MNIYLHVGMNKAGSTSIQNVLRKNAEIILERYGVSYNPSNQYFSNHFELYELLSKSADFSETSKYLKKIVNKARRNKAKNLIISCEDLFLLPKHVVAFNVLREALHALKNVKVKVIMVVRHPRSWALSYLKQLISNGAMSFDIYAPITIGSLAADVVRCIRAYQNMGFAFQAISFRNASESGSLIREFFSALDITAEVDWEVVTNKTGAERLTSAELLIGFVCGGYAFTQRAHPNSENLDDLRVTLRDRLDAYTRNADAYKLLVDFDGLIVEQLVNVVEKSINELPIVDQSLLNELDGICSK